MELLKKIILFTLTIFSGITLEAQSPSYLNLSASWAESSANCCCSGYCYYVDVIITLPGDTIINGRSYYKTLYAGTSTIYDLWGDSIVSVEPILQPGNLLREEDAKFYRYHPSSGNDILFADFNLEVGDTAVQQSCQSNLVVDHIDTLYLGNEPRRKFYFSPEGSFGSTLIEGIGSSRGLFESPCQEIGIEGGSSLICFNLNNNSIQISPGECGTISSTWDNEHSASIDLYPNPVTDVLNFKTSFPLTDDVDVIIFDAQGNRLRKIKMSATHSRMDLSTLLPGVYFVNIIHAGTFYSKKIVKGR